MSAKSTAPVCSVDGGRLLSWDGVGKSGADYICTAGHGANATPLFFRTVWEGTGHGSTYHIEPIPGQDTRPRMTPAEARLAGRPE